MKYILLLCAITSLIVSGWASAYHTNFTTYDTSTEITVEGIVTALELVNPHAWIYLNVTNEAGDLERWKIELAGKLSLSRRGRTDNSVAEGDHITVIGNPSH
jgi:hypothetical protein|tara:strand:- start:95 stop:400 length:306 start_codon:yes stop_codon:yes gene_type:complete